MGIHSVPVNGTVLLMGTYLLNSLTRLPVVRISNFVYSVPVNRTPINRTVRLTGNCMSPVNGTYFISIPVLAYPSATEASITVVTFSSVSNSNWLD